MSDLKERLEKMDQTPMTREEMLESLIEKGYLIETTAITKVDRIKCLMGPLDSRRI